MRPGVLLPGFQGATTLRILPILAVSLIIGLLGGGTGCSYTSEYPAPVDGRMRAVWRENNVIMQPSGASISQECAQEIMRLTDSSRLRLPKEYVVTRPPEGYWTPRYYGPPIVVYTPGLAPVLPGPPLFLPSVVLASGARGAGFGSLPLLPGFGGGSPNVNLGSDGGKLLVVLAVIALLVLPAVDLGLAVARPESPAGSSQAIDQVNAYNDLARSPGSPCYYAGPVGAP